MRMVSKTEVGNAASSEKDRPRSGSTISCELDTASDSICYHTHLKSCSLCLIHHTKAAQYLQPVSPNSISKQYLPCLFSASCWINFPQSRRIQRALHSTGTKTLMLFSCYTCKRSRSQKGFDLFWSVNRFGVLNSQSICIIITCNHIMLGLCGECEVVCFPCQ